MKRLLQRLRPASQQGQSLVELAITAPILVFMLLGVLEVGWALRGYLVLTNINREITRYAVRQGYLDYAQKNNNPYTHTLPAGVTVGYDDVVSYTYRTLSDQIVLDFSDQNTSTLIISHMVADTGLACRNNNCDCNQFVTNPNFYLNGTNVLTYDDLILHPGVRGYDNFYAQTYPHTSTRVTKLDYAADAAQLARENNKFNCELLRKSGGTIPASNNVIVTEIYYRQPQLFGFPVISNPYTDPVEMYAHTAMRIIVSSRSGENVDSVGPVCDVYPFALNNTTPLPNVGDEIDILGAGWVKWNSLVGNSQTYISDALKYSRMPLNDFKESGNPSDTSLNIGDRLTIDSSTYTGLYTDVVNLAQKEIRIPMGSGNPFVISRFVKVRIGSDAADINLGANTVMATYLGEFQVDDGGFPICLTSD